MDQSGVPVVLDGIVWATQQVVGDLGPAILKALVKDVEHPVLFCWPSCLFQERVKLIVPALTALFTGAAGHVARDHIPLERANLWNHG